MRFTCTSYLAGLGLGLFIKRLIFIWTCTQCVCQNYMLIKYWTQKQILLYQTKLITWYIFSLSFCTQCCLLLHLPSFCRLAIGILISNWAYFLPRVLGHTLDETLGQTIRGAQESKMGILVLIGTVMGLSFVLWIISIAARTYMHRRITKTWQHP